jgi:AraC-like DNA-binding protein
MPPEANPASALPQLAYLRPAALPGVELVSSVFRGALAPAFIDHRYLFGRTDAGDGDVVLGGNTVLRLHAGTLLALEPGDVVAGRARRSAETRHRSAMIEPAVVRRFVESAFPDAPHPHVSRGLLGEAAVQAFDALWDAVATNEVALAQQCRLAAFLEAAVAPAVAPLGRTPLTPPIALARRMLDERVGDDVRLEDLEAFVGLSRFYLVRRFGAEVGLPPHAYQLALRLDRARTLLAQGERLGDVAIRCGFTDQSHLTRHFRRVVGVAPGAYARTARQGR